MKKKSFAIWLSVFWILIALLGIAGVTYAWFTFNPATNVEPMTSTVSDGDVALLIALSEDGDFNTQCALPQSSSGDLEPISTADLEHFYQADIQNRQGISLTFLDARDRVDADTIHGTLYLKSLKDNCEVYFNRNSMEFGDDPQMLAALRLGLKITTEAGTHLYIFTLDDVGSISGAVGMQTTAQSKVVVAGVEADGSPNYVADPCRSMSDYYAVIGAEKLPRAGRAPLCTIQADEVVTVEYWLYLEGCDEQCINEVQERTAILRLSFAGVTAQ